MSVQPYLTPPTNRWALGSRLSYALRYHFYRRRKENAFWVGNRAALDALKHEVTVLVTSPKLSPLEVMALRRTLNRYTDFQRLVWRPDPALWRQEAVLVFTDSNNTEFIYDIHVL